MKTTLKTRSNVRGKQKENNWPPLRLQYEAGVEAFRNRRQWTRVKNGATVIITSNPHKIGTMQNKEWQRGYDTEYFRNIAAGKRGS